MHTIVWSTLIIMIYNMTWFSTCFLYSYNFKVVNIQIVWVLGECRNVFLTEFPTMRSWYDVFLIVLVWLIMTHYYDDSFATVTFSSHFRQTGGSVTNPNFFLFLCRALWANSNDTNIAMVTHFLKPINLLFNIGNYCTRTRVWLVTKTFSKFFLSIL